MLNLFQHLNSYRLTLKQVQGDNEEFFFLFFPVNPIFANIFSRYRRKK